MQKANAGIHSGTCRVDTVVSQTFNSQEYHHRRSLLCTLHSSAVALAVLSTNVVQTNNLLGQLDVVTKVARVAEATKNVDNVLLLAQELLQKLIALLLPELFCRDLDDLLAPLRHIFSRHLALAANRLALRWPLYWW